MGFIIRKLCFDSHRFVKLSVSNVPKCQSTYKLQSPDPLLEKNVYKTNFPHSSGWQLVHVYKVPEVGIKIPSHIMYSNHLTMGVEIAIGWCWWRRYFGRHKLACVWIFLTGNIYFAMRDTLEILCPFGRGGGGRSFKSSFLLLLPYRLVCSFVRCNNLQ